MSSCLGGVVSNVCVSTFRLSEQTRNCVLASQGVLPGLLFVADSSPAQLVLPLLTHEPPGRVTGRIHRPSPLAYKSLCPELPRPAWLHSVRRYPLSHRLLCLLLQEKHQFLPQSYKLSRKSTDSIPLPYLFLQYH